LHTPNCNFDCAILKYWIIKVIGSGRITSDVWLDPNYYRGVCWHSPVTETTPTRCIPLYWPPVVRKMCFFCFCWHCIYTKGFIKK